jgi:hypothetical protein
MNTPREGSGGFPRARPAIPATIFAAWDTMIRILAPKFC